MIYVRKIDNGSFKKIVCVVACSDFPKMSLCKCNIYDAFYESIRNTANLDFMSTKLI